jgi:hypothetical protein
MERWDDLQIDYSDLLSTIIGISVHERNERLSADEEDVEHRMEDQVHGVTLVGKSDCYDAWDEAVRDTKTKGTGFVVYDDAKKQIEQQLNIYSWQLRNRGKVVSVLDADIFYRDWKLYEAQKSQEKWAAIKPGAKKATRLFGSQTDADFFCLEHSDHVVEFRPAKPYPVIAFETYSPRLWSHQEQQQFIEDQIEYHVTCPMDCPLDCRWKNGLRCQEYCRVRSVCDKS